MGFPVSSPCLRTIASWSLKGEYRMTRYYSHANKCVISSDCPDIDRLGFNFISISVRKYPDKKQLREERFYLAYNSRL